MGCLHGGRKTQALGRSSKADQPSAIQFTCKKLYSAPALGTSSLRDRKIPALMKAIFARKILSGSSMTAAGGPAIFLLFLLH